MPPSRTTRTGSPAGPATRSCHRWRQRRRRRDQARNEIADAFHYWREEPLALPIGNQAAFDDAFGQGSSDWTDQRPSDCTPAPTIRPVVRLPPFKISSSSAIAIPIIKTGQPRGGGRSWGPQALFRAPGATKPPARRFFGLDRAPVLGDPCFSIGFGRERRVALRNTDLHGECSAATRDHPIDRLGVRVASLFLWLARHRLLAPKGFIGCDD